MNYKIFFVACALNLFYYVPNLLASPIIGGEDDPFNSFRYHVAVQKFNPSISNRAEHLGGGTIIHDRYVLSSAHLFLIINNGHVEFIRKPSSDNIVVLTGTSETHGPGLIMKVVKILIPRQYTTGVYADISVLRLYRELDVIYHRDIVASLPIDQGILGPEFFENKEAIVLGNGCSILPDGQEEPSYAPIRQFLWVTMTTKNECPQFDVAICAVNRDPIHIRTCCKGDAGSPIIYGNHVIGVISQEPDDCHSRAPILSTRISIFYNFIQNVINGHVDHANMHILEN